MSGGGGSSQPAPPSQQTITNRTEIPAFLRPFVERQATVGTEALETLPGLLGGGDRLTVPFDPLEQAAQAAAVNRAASFDPSSVFGTTRDALESTARGDFLFGGQGFDQAVDAAVRAARPAAIDTFGRGGSSLGGLALGEAATNAFASQFNTERQRQLAAASALPELSLREFEAGFAPSDILGQIGQQRRSLALQQQLAPITAQEALLQAAGGGVPLGSLLGQTQTSVTSGQPIFRNRGAGVLGGGLAGLGLGAATAAEGATGLAALGGPLGIGLGVGGAVLGGLLS